MPLVDDGLRGKLPSLDTNVALCDNSVNIKTHSIVLQYYVVQTACTAVLSALAALSEKWK
jgi:hypothetical protein